jgi:uncharacterized protein
MGETPFGRGRCAPARSRHAIADLSLERRMIADISSRREELRELCRRFHVRRRDLFGSASREDFDPARSDLDFLVEFDSCFVEALSLKTSFTFKESLEALFGRSVDLVEPGALRNPYLKASIEGSRKPVFEA